MTGSRLPTSDQGCWMMQLSLDVTAAAVSSDAGSCVEVKHDIVDSETGPHALQQQQQFILSSVPSHGS